MARDDYSHRRMLVSLIGSIVLGKTGDRAVESLRSISVTLFPFPFSFLLLFVGCSFFFLFFALCGAFAWILIC